jgi:hypothetical protein
MTPLLRSPSQLVNPLARQRFLGFGTAPGGAAFVGALDAFTAGLSGAWSVARRLVASYTSALIRVRRSSDNAELDINAFNGILDVASIASFCSGTTGFVSTIYNQFGIASNLTAAAANQGRIYNAGAVIVKNGLPMIEVPPAATVGYAASFAAQTPTAVSYAGVVSPVGIGNYHGQVGNPSTSFAPNGAILLYESSATTMQPFVAFGSRGNAIATTSGTLVSAGCVIGASNTTVYKNGTPTLAAAYTPTFNFAGYGFWNAGATISGTIAAGACWAEGILWTGERASSVAAITANQQTYFGT